MAHIDRFRFPDPTASVLLEFRAENARSFLEQAVLSLEGTRLSEPGIVRQVRWRQGGQPLSVLPVAGIFGANASGKSNLLKAMDDLRKLVIHSFQQGEPGSGIAVHNFLLGGDGNRWPTSYEIDLVLEDVRHEYGVRINSQRVSEEWLYSYPRGRATMLFHRREDEVRLGAGERQKGRATVEILRPNALFVSTAAAINHPQILPLYQWFRRNLRLADVDSRDARQTYTARLLEDGERKDRLLDFLREADLGISGAVRREIDPALRNRIAHGGQSEDDEAEVLEQLLAPEDFEVRLTHRSAVGDVELPASDESLGTLIWFGMAGPVVDALADGSVLLADELDASLHPALVDALVRLFQSQESNPRRAQLIFNSHDVNLMGDSGTHTLGRDQIWFTEKDNDGGTRVYPLTDMDPRKGEAIGRRYLAGRYGGTPIVSTRQFERIAAPATLDPAE
jgi:hypothetical protein